MTEKAQACTTVQSVSIILAAHNQAAELRRNLPQLLTQDYEAGFEVIVVDMSSTDETGDILKQLQNQYSNLYTTYIPASSHYLSRKKLALTIGLKAAKHKWAVITEPTCHPENSNWLQSMVQFMSDEVDVVCGYTAYDEGTDGMYAYLRMLAFWQQGRHPYRYDGASLGIRKQIFMERNGFLKNLQYLRSEYDFLVNETPPGRIAVTKLTDGRIRQEGPTKKMWTNQQLYYMQIRNHLDRTLQPRMLFAIHQFLIHLCYILGIAILAWAIYQANLPFAIGSSAFLLLLIIGRMMFGRYLTKSYGEHISLWKLPLLDLGVAWHYLFYRIKFLLTNKYDFVRK